MKEDIIRAAEDLTAANLRASKINRVINLLKEKESVERSRKSQLESLEKEIERVSNITDESEIWGAYQSNSVGSC